MNELRTVVRRLIRTPGFTLVSVLTLAIGIGANAAIFSLVYGILLEPLPYPDSARLVTVQHDAPGFQLEDMGLSKPLYLRYRAESGTLSEIGIFDDREVTITGDDRPERLRAASVTGSVFDTLRIAPLMGRTFVDEDSAPGAPAIVVLGESVWRSRFGGAQDAIGRTLEINGESREIVGIMPDSFHFPADETVLWTPRPIDPESISLGAFQEIGIARLADGVTIESAETDLRRLIADLPAAFPDEVSAALLQESGFRVRVVPYRDVIVGNLRQALWVLLGGVGLILLIACANVANLFLVRAEGRHREVALRSALGAGRGQLIVSGLLESLALAAAGGIVGLALAAGATRFLRSLSPDGLPRLDHVGMDPAVLLFTLGATLLAGVLFGVWPAVRSTSVRLDIALKEGSRGASVGPRRLVARHALVIGQVALALVLMVGAGLMLRSLERLFDIDPGFTAHSVLSFTTPLPQAKYVESEQIARWLDQTIAELRALPGVVSVAAVRDVPLSGERSGSGYFLEDFPPQSDQDLPPVFYDNNVTADFFRSLGIPILEGRALERADWEQRTGAVVVSKSLAEAYWPGKSALGRHIWPNGRDDDEQRWYEIVGVAGDVRSLRLEQEPPQTVYYPLLGHEGRGEDAPPTMSFVIRTEGDPRALADAARARVWQLEPDVPIAEMRTLDDLLSRARGRMRFTVLLLSLASALALLLSLIGLYGVVSYLVSLRRREIGIRMALGADRGRVLGMVLREGLSIGGIGVVLGIVGAMLSSRGLSSLLYEVDPLDPATFVGTSALLLSATVAASLLPARRASATDPQVALREE